MFKHAFLFIKNFLLLLELSVIICTHSALTVFKKFSENSLTHKYLSSIQLNNIFCAAKRILCLFNINTSGSRLSMVINCSFRPFNLADTDLLVNLPVNLKLQRRCSFQYAVEQFQGSSLKTQSFFRAVNSPFNRPICSTEGINFNHSFSEAFKNQLILNFLHYKDRENRDYISHFHFYILSTAVKRCLL